MNNNRIAEIRARCEAATPGDWRTPPSHSGVVAQHHGDIFYRGANGTNADMQFIAFAREDIPYLLEQLVSANAEIERLREAQRWIPVGERLPGTYQHENGEPIEFNVIIDNAKVATTVSFDGKEWRDFWEDGSYGITYKVTHWMPLPATPEEGEAHD